MNVLNFHLTDSCNYNCEYCFGKFPNEADLPQSEAKKVVDNLCRYIKKAGYPRGRINLAGGEPLLYKEIDGLIDYVKEKGLEVSVITNASLLTEERVARWKGKVSCIGVSVDSATEGVNISIGRSCAGRVLTNERLIKAASAIHESGIKLKVNTVVSKFNCNEDMRELYRALKPDRLKFMQMQIVEGVNACAEKQLATAAEFTAFCERHKNCSPDTVEEPLGSMQNAYLIISPRGDITLNDNGACKVYGNCLKDEFYEIFKSMPTDAQKFESRYKKGNA